MGIGLDEDRKSYSKGSNLVHLGFKKNLKLFSCLFSFKKKETPASLKTFLLTPHRHAGYMRV